MDLKAIPNSISDVPETNEAPTNHNNMHNMNHMEEKVEDKKVDEDEDVEYLNRLEEDLVIRKFLNKHLNSI